MDGSKEFGAELQRICNALRVHGSEITALRHAIEALTSRLEARLRQSADGDVPQALDQEATPDAPLRTHFLARALARKHQEFGFPAAEMSRLLKTTPATVYRWESGRAHPQVAQIRRIKEVLGMEKHKALDALMQHDPKAPTYRLKAAQRQVAKVNPQPAAVRNAAPDKARQTHFPAQALVRKRKELGITVLEMAELLEASAPAVYAWESGRRLAGVAYLERIGEVFKMSERQAFDALGKLHSRAPTSRGGTTQHQIMDAGVAQAFVQDPDPGKPQQTRLLVQALARKREEFGIPATAMARLLKTSTVTVYRWKSGQANPRALLLRRIEEVLKMDKRQALNALSRDLPYHRPP